MKRRQIPSLVFALFALGSISACYWFPQPVVMSHGIQKEQNVESGEITFVLFKTIETGKIELSNYTTTIATAYADERFVSVTDKTEDRVPLAGAKARVLLPTGHEYPTISDQQGRMTVTLPDNQALYFPMDFVVKVIIEPQVDAEKRRVLKKDGRRWEIFRSQKLTFGPTKIVIPANAKNLLALPPTVAQHARGLAAAVKDARAEYDNAVKATDEAVNAPWQEFLAEANRHPCFVVWGTVRDHDRENLVLWGQAHPVPCEGNNLETIPTSSREWAEGNLAHDGNIVVSNYDVDHLCPSGTYLSGKHHYIGKSRGKGVFGQTVPIRVYGDAPNKPEIEKKRERLRKVLAVHTPGLKNAREGLRVVLDHYERDLPTNPFGLDLTVPKER